LYICGAVGTVVNILAVFFIFVGSWYPAGYPTLAEWNAWMIGITVISVISGVLIYAISQQSRRGKSDEQLLTEMAPAGGGGAGE
jgi:general stress protein CsbA